MIEEPIPKAPADVSAPVAEAAPPAESPQTPSIVEDGPSCEMPKWFAKLQAVIPSKIAPAKLSPRVARKVAFWLTLIGAFAVLGSMSSGDGYYNASPDDFSPGPGYFGALLGIMALWLSAVAIKTVKSISKELAVSVVVVAVVSCSTIIAGFKLVSIAETGYSLCKRAQDSTAALDKLADTVQSGTDAN